MASIGNLTVALFAQTRAFIVDMQRVQTVMQKTARSMTEQAERMQQAGRTMMLGLTAPLLLAGGSAVKAAMDVVESENLFAVSMGRMADAARAFSERLRRELGLNAYEVRRNVATFYQMLTAMGLSEKAAYDMATGLTQLAYDMASFFNLQPEEAFEKLRAGIVGETEPLKQLGILVDEATAQQVALARGLAKSGQELTQQQKVLARYLAIMEQTKNAQGDLARTLNSPTNQIRILTQQLDELQIAIGMALIPMVQSALPVLRSMAEQARAAAEAFGMLPAPIRNTALALGLLGVAAGPVVYGLGVMLRVAAGVTRGIQLIAQFAYRAWAAFGAWWAGTVTLRAALQQLFGAQLWRVITSRFTLIAAGVAIAVAAGAWLVNSWRKVVAGIKFFAYSIAAAVVEMAALAVRGVAWLLNVLGYIIPWARSGAAYLYGLSARLEGVAVRLVRTGYATWTAAKAAGVSVGRLRELERSALPAAKGTKQVGDATRYLGDAAQRAADAQRNLTRSVKKATEEWGRNLQTFDEVHLLEQQAADSGGAGGAATDIAPVVQAYKDWGDALSGVAAGLGNVGTAMENLAGGMGGPTNTVLSLWGEIKRGADELWKTVTEKWGEIKNGVLEKARGIWQDVTTWWGNIKNAVSTKLQGIWSDVTTWWGNIKNTVLTNVQGIWSDVTTWWQNIKNSVLEKVMGIWTDITTWWSNIKNEVLTKVQGIWTDVTTWWGNIKNAVLTKLQGIWGDVVTCWGNIKNEVLLKVQGIWTDVTTWWGTIKMDVLTRVQGIHGDVVRWWGNIKTDVLSKVQGIWGDVTTWWNNIKTDVGIKLEEIYNSVTTKWQDIKNEVYNKAYGIRDDVVGAIEKLKERWDEIWGGIKTTATNIGREIKDTVRGVVNSVIGFINRMIDAWNRLKFTVPEVEIPFVGKFGGFTIGVSYIPHIPYLAKGGIITDPTLAVVGERGPEAVVPLSRSNPWAEEIAEAVYAAVRDAMRISMSQARVGNGEGEREIVLRLDGRNVARGLLPHIIAEGQRQGLHLVVRPAGI